MAVQVQTIRNLLKDTGIAFVIDAILSIIFGRGNVWIGIAFFFLFLFIIGAYLIFRKYERLFKVIWSGAEGYYYSFPPEENTNIWEKTDSSLKYMGISAYTIFPSFKVWAESLASNSPLKFYFLLMSPDAKALEKQLLHEKGISDSSQIQDELKAIRSRIKSHIDDLKVMKIYKDDKLQIKLYDEFVPWWMYMLDDEEIYLGLLPKGKPGIDSPLLTMKKVKKFTTLFDSFHNTWERMWEDAVWEVKSRSN